MENKYPCYRVITILSLTNMYFEKSRDGLEAAIEFASKNKCHFVTCLASANAKPEIVWSSGLSRVIKLRGVNGAPITSYKQTDRP